MCTDQIVVHSSATRWKDKEVFMFFSQIPGLSKYIMYPAFLYIVYNLESLRSVSICKDNAGELTLKTFRANQ